VARLVANYILIKAGYLPAVVHSIERQRYYEVLRHENDGLLNLVIESLENSIDTTQKFFGELANVKLKRAS
jgi:Fic family protein